MLTRRLGQRSSATRGCRWRSRPSNGRRTDGVAGPRIPWPCVTSSGVGSAGLEEATLARANPESCGSADRIVKMAVLALTKRGVIRCCTARARCLTAAYLVVARLYPSGRRRALRGRRRGARQGFYRAETEHAYDEAWNEAANSDGEDGRPTDVSSRGRDVSQPRIWRSRGSTHLVVAARSEEETRRAARLHARRRSSPTPMRRRE